MQANVRLSCRCGARGRRRCTGRSRVALTACIAALALLLPRAAVAQTQEDGEISTFFVGLGAGLCTLVYTPLKVVYALSALPMSGLVYLWSVGDTEMSGRVMRSGTQGTYVVTPEHLRGDASLDFVGEANEGPHPDEQERSR